MIRLIQCGCGELVDSGYRLVGEPCLPAPVALHLEFAFSFYPWHDDSHNRSEFYLLGYAASEHR